MAGYSATPLVRKLGIKPANRVSLLRAPAGFDALIGEWPGDVVVSTRLVGRRDVVVGFFTERHDLARRLPAMRTAIEPDGMIWIAWPKRASGLATDITEDVIREVVLPTGLVDVKVCAIDDTWSGLKIVVRKALRGAASRE